MELELSPIRGYIEVLVFDKEGRVVQQGRHPMRSFLNNFLKFFEAFSKSDGVSITDTGGTARTIYGSGVGYQSRLGGLAPDNDDSYGILVGSGTTPVDLTQIRLASKITHGTATGQLDYDAVSVDDLGLDTSVTPPVYRFRLCRTFKNLSTASVTITEVGIAVRTRQGGDDLRFLISRDLLPTSYTVPAGGSAAVIVTVEVEMG